MKSREQHFYYGHPQNRFWKVIAALTKNETPETMEEKKRLLLKSGIAVWDVIASCTITGSSDSSIRDVTPNDLSVILDHAEIRQIFCNGTTSYNYYRKYQEPLTGISAVRLPSTSPANAAWSLQRLEGEWSRIRTYLDEQPAEADL